MTCKQMHAEALQLYYQTAIFTIEHDRVLDGIEWLIRLPDHYRQWLGHVVFQRDLQNVRDMYSKLVYRALSEDGKQAMLLQPLVTELHRHGIRLRDGVLRA